MSAGVRQICLLLIPSAVLMAVLAEPITRLLYQRGEFGPEATDLVTTALVWWSISLPFQGVSLLFSRTFFSLQRPWATTALAGVNLVVNAARGARAVQAVRHRRDRDRHGRGHAGDDGRPGLDAARTSSAASRGAGLLASGVRMLLRPRPLAAAPPTAPGTASTRRSAARLGAQIASVGVAIAAGVAVYAGAVWALRVPEARQIRAPAAWRRRLDLRRAGASMFCHHAAHERRRSRPAPSPASRRRTGAAGRTRSPAGSPERPPARRSARVRRRAMSIPDDTPAAVMTLPRSTTRSGTGVAPSSPSRSRSIQWVVASSPSSTPAAPSTQRAGAYRRRPLATSRAPSGPTRAAARPPAARGCRCRRGSPAPRGPGESS